MRDKISRRLSLLEREVDPPEQIIPVLDCPENRAAVEDERIGPFLPGNPTTTRVRREIKQRSAAGIVTNKVTHDWIVWVSELESAL